MPQLLTIKEAAAELGVPKGSLKTAAKEHGFIVRMGRAQRIDRNDLAELVKTCRNTPKVPVSTADRTASTTSATDRTASQRALETAERLKRLSPGTSRNGVGRAQGRVIPLK